MYAIIVAIWTIGEMLQVPIMPALVAGLSPSTARGRYQATFQVSFSAAAFLGPVIGGFAIGTFGQNALWTGCLALGVIVAGLNIALSSARHRRLAEAPTA